MCFSLFSYVWCFSLISMVCLLLSHHLSFFLWFHSQLNLAPWVSLSLFHVFRALSNLLLCLVCSSALCITLIVINPSLVNRHLLHPPPLNPDHMVMISLADSVSKCSPRKPPQHLYFLSLLMTGLRSSLHLDVFIILMCFSSN